MVYPYLSFVFRAFFTFLPFLYFSRVLSEEEYAVITFCYTIFIIVSSLSEFGFTFLGFKDAAIKWEYHVQNNLLKIKFIFCLIVVVAAFYYSFNTGFVQYKNYNLLFFFIFSGILNSFGLHIASLFRALENFKIDCLYNLYKASVLVMSLSISSDTNLEVIGYSYLLCTFLSFTFIYSRFHSLRTKSDTKKEKVSSTFSDKKSGLFVYGTQTILVIGYMQLDSQIVAFYLGTIEMSRYLDITRIVIGASMAGEVLVMRSIPGYIRNFNDSKMPIAKNEVFSFLFILASITFATLDFYGINFFELVYGERGSGIDSKYIFIVILIVYLRTLGVIPSTLLSSSKSRSKRVYFLFFILCMSLGLNFIFVPHYGFEAALFVLLIVNVLLSFIYVFYMQFRFGLISFGFVEFINIVLMLSFFFLDSY